MIAVIDYGAGNLTSLTNALDTLNAPYSIVDNPNDLAKCDKIIFPGQGAFKDAMDALVKRDLVRALQKTKKPYLGICIGMQVLFDESDENPGMQGLGIISGRCEKFKGSFKVPQMGWNQIKKENDSVTLNNIKNNSFVYFVHSYHCIPQNKEVILTKTEYGGDFVSGVEQDNFMAFQFHPERSGTIGLKILKNFVENV